MMKPCILSLEQQREGQIEGKYISHDNIRLLFKERLPIMASINGDGAFAIDYFSLGVGRELLLARQTSQREPPFSGVRAEVKALLGPAMGYGLGGKIGAEDNIRQLQQSMQRLGSLGTQLMAAGLLKIVAAAVAKNIRAQGAEIANPLATETLIQRVAMGMTRLGTGPDAFDEGVMQQKGIFIGKGRDASPRAPAMGGGLLENRRLNLLQTVPDRLLRPSG
jgi:hypothetical protein